MERAAVVIKDILQEILVQASEQQVQAVDSDTTIRYMNRFMASLDATGISLNYTAVKNPSDFITIPDGALEGLIFNVALRLSTSYDIPVNPSLQISAREGMAAMQSIAVNIQPSRFPSSLPIGSGNEDDGSTYTLDHFYSDNDSLVESEIGNGSIQLESNTNDQ